MNFSEPDLCDGGVRRAEFISVGKVSPLIFICSFSDYLEEYIGVRKLSGLSSADWLSFSFSR